MKQNDAPSVPVRQAALSLLAVDDHPLMLAGIAAMVDGEPSLTLVGTASNGLDALAQYQRLCPDVVLLDLNVQECSGVDAVGRIRAIHADARIIVLTSRDGQEDIYLALAAGASGYLLKTADIETLLHCIRQVAAGMCYLPTDLTAKLASRIVANQLSARELEVLAHLSTGKSNKIIARTIGIGLGTVKYHVNNILAKLNVSCRTEAASVAAGRGLVRVVDGYTEFAVAWTERPARGTHGDAARYAPVRIPQRDHVHKQRTGLFPAVQTNRARLENHAQLISTGYTKLVE